MSTPNTCPFTNGFALTGVATAPNGIARYDDLQDESHMWHVNEPDGEYWMILDRELALNALQDPATFSSRAVVPTDPNPAYTMLPIMLDPPMHSKWRKLLAGYFSPNRLPELEGTINALSSQLIDQILTGDSCDYVQDFALKFPTTIILAIVGLPLEDLDKFLAWEQVILHPDENGHRDKQAKLATVMQVMGMFAQEIERRRSSPDPAATDIITAALSWEIDGEQVKDHDILSVCLLLFMAGLDTVASELSFAMHHLATHPEDQAYVRANPDKTPAVVEELLRAFPVVQLGRQITHDVEFGGADMKAGDMVLVSLAGANRDPSTLRDARHVVLDREETLPHFSFGAGPHRCLGSHIARKEMTRAIEEWHARVPEYRLDTDAPVQEFFTSVHGLKHLPLTWRS